jgi:hypothetical protein
MTKKLFFYIICMLFAGLILWSCSNSSGEESEKGAIRKMTDQVAHDLSHKIRNPIDKARAAKEQEENRLNDLEDTAEESSRDE